MHCLAGLRCSHGGDEGRRLPHRCRQRAAMARARGVERLRRDHRQRRSRHLVIAVAGLRGARASRASLTPSTHGEDRAEAGACLLPHPGRRHHLEAARRDERDRKDQEEDAHPHVSLEHAVAALDGAGAAEGVGGAGAAAGAVVVAGAAGCRGVVAALAPLLSGPEFARVRTSSSRRRVRRWWGFRAHHGAAAAVRDGLARRAPRPVVAARAARGEHPCGTATSL